MSRSSIGAVNAPGDIFPRYQLSVVYGSGSFDLDLLFNTDPGTSDVTTLEGDFFPAMVDALQEVPGVSSVSLFKMTEAVTDITPS